jgi:hypothetical protein
VAHKKFYYALCALVVVMIFGTAAICNMCAAGSATTEKIGTDQETVAASTAKVTESTAGDSSKDSSSESTAKETSTSESATESTAAESTASDKEAPAITLEIYEGPTYSAAGNICYYRVQAKVKGKPAPTVTFSKDDSGGAWGSKKVQVNLNDPSDTYTLTATATNSEGSAEDSIELSWGCPIPETEPITENKDLKVVESKSGYIIVELAAYVNDAYAFVGDYTNDRQIKTYLTFDIEDISDLEDVDVKDASISMPVDAIMGHPELMPEVHVRVFDYGNTLELADQGSGGEFVKIFPTTDSMESFDFSGSDLEAALQDAIDAGDDRFQLKFSLSGINIDGIQDWYRFIMDDIELHIEYEIPG